MTRINSILTDATCEGVSTLNALEHQSAEFFYTVIEKEKKSKQVVRNYLCDATSQMEWLGYEIIHV